jgi:hypothetical protein
MAVDNTSVHEIWLDAIRNEMLCYLMILEQGRLYNSRSGV